MSAVAGCSRLFHAIVVMGLSCCAGACGGQTTATATGDAGDDAPGSAGDATRSDDATGASDVAADDVALGTDASMLDAPLPADASNAGDAADAYGYENDAGMCVCPPGVRSSPAPCCPASFGACAAWPCYV
jgi:hypothetical protein